MKPILFNTEMVRAILEGRKTVTRRVVKTKHKDACGFYVTTRPSDGVKWVYDYDEHESMYGSPQTPPYWVNDILWVRETWAINPRPNMYGNYYYKANRKAVAPEGTKWKPSIHMPKEAARIFLRVTGVRVERLQDMKLEDFLNEGISIDEDEVLRELNLLCDDDSLAEAKFRQLWDSTLGRPHTPEYYGNCWSNNPYVWVIEFEVISKEEALAAAVL